MFNLGFPELILILLIALVIFGPGKLPSVGQAIGGAIKEFKKAISHDPEPAPPLRDNKPEAERQACEEKNTKNGKTEPYNADKGNNGGRHCGN